MSAIVGNPEQNVSLNECPMFFFYHTCDIKIPIVVMTVPAKKMDWPKLQFGLDLVTFLTAEIPLLVACTIFVINSSNSASERKNETS